MRTILSFTSAATLLGVAAYGVSGNEESTSVAVTQDGASTSIAPYTAIGEDTGTRVPPAAADTGAVQAEVGSTGASSTASSASSPSM